MLNQKVYWIFVLFLIFSQIQCKLIQRLKRQTVVNTNSETNGEGDLVDTDASAHHFKNSAGLIGMNMTSSGKSKGASKTIITNAASGSVGNSNLNTSGTVKSIGDMAESYSDIFAAIEGEKFSLNSDQQVKSFGLGSTFANLTGGGVVTNSERNTKNFIQTASAGASGSLGSQSEIFSGQTMTWDSLMSQLVGSAVAEGIGNAQANMDFSSGTNENSMEISGLVSGSNNAKGNVSSQVNGNDNIVNGERTVFANLYGYVEGKKNSTVLGASSITTNSSKHNGFKAFGNGNSYSNGNSSYDLRSETGIQDESGIGQIVLNGTAVGSESSLVANNGLKVNEDEKEIVLLGEGRVDAVGTNKNSNASHYIDTSYNEHGETRILSKGEGQSISNRNDSKLELSASGSIAAENQTFQDGRALGSGFASGTNSNITGTSFSNVDQSSASGNSVINSFGGGPGPSAVKSNVTLVLSENGKPKVQSAHGEVSANGDHTNVQSFSILSNYAGAETLSNYQKASSTSFGSSRSSASSGGFLKRRKRSSSN